MKENVHKCRTCLNCLELFTWMSLNKLINETILLEMPKQIELMTTENRNGNKKSTYVYYESLWNVKNAYLLK